MTARPKRLNSPVRTADASHDVGLDIHEACRRGKVTAVIQYLDHGGFIDKPTSRMETPLLLAAQFAHPDLVRLIFDRGADIRSCDCKGETPLTYVCYGGYVELFQYLQEKVRDQHPGYIKASHRQLFTAACKGGCIEMIEYLLGQAESHHDVLVSLLALFEEDGSSDVIKCIVKLHGILHSACELGSVEVVSFLIGQGANPSGITEFGQTPLHAACTGGKGDIVKYLLSLENVDSEVKDFRGLTPMHMACLAGSLDSVTCLLDRGVDITEACDEGVTGLDLVCNEGHKVVIKYLLDRGKLEDINSALYASCEGGHLDVVELLLSEGADIHAKHDFGETVMFAACQNEQLSVIEYLYKAGADVNASTGDGVSLLAAASEVGNMDIVRFLLSKGAKVDAMTDEGKTAIHAAYDYDHLPVANLIFKKWLINVVTAQVNDAGKPSLLEDSLQTSDTALSLEPLFDVECPVILCLGVGEQTKAALKVDTNSSVTDADVSSSNITSCQHVTVCITCRQPAQDTWTDMGTVGLSITPSDQVSLHDVLTHLDTMSVYFPCRPSSDVSGVTDVEDIADKTDKLELK